MNKLNPIRVQGFANWHRDGFNSILKLGRLKLCIVHWEPMNQSFQAVSCLQSPVIMFQNRWAAKEFSESTLAVVEEQVANSVLPLLGLGPSETYTTDLTLLDPNEIDLPIREESAPDEIDRVLEESSNGA